MGFFDDAWNVVKRTSTAPGMVSNAFHGKPLMEGTLLDGETWTGESGGGSSFSGSRPAYPTYQSASDLDSRFQMTAPGADQEILGKLKDRAMSEGDSPWASAMMARQGLDESNQKGNVQAQVGAQSGKLRDQLAMNGGMSGGAGERAGMFAMEQGNARMQDIAGKGMDDRYKIAADDDARKMDIAGNYANIRNQMYAPDMQAQQYNSSAAREEGARKNAFNLGRFDSASKQYGAERSAHAVENSGKK